MLIAGQSPDNGNEGSSLLLESSTKITRKRTVITGIAVDSRFIGQRIHVWTCHLREEPRNIEF